jgi:hypothetical protein
MERRQPLRLDKLTHHGRKGVKITIFAGVPFGAVPDG